MNGRELMQIIMDNDALDTEVVVSGTSIDDGAEEVRGGVNDALLLDNDDGDIEVVLKISEAVVEL